MTLFQLNSWHLRIWPNGGERKTSVLKNLFKFVLCFFFLLSKQIDTFHFHFLQISIHCLLIFYSEMFSDSFPFIATTIFRNWEQLFNEKQINFKSFAYNGVRIWCKCLCVHLWCVYMRMTYFFKKCSSCSRINANQIDWMVASSKKKISPNIQLDAQLSEREWRGKRRRREKEERKKKYSRFVYS